MAIQKLNDDVNYLQYDVYSLLRCCFYIQLFKVVSIVALSIQLFKVAMRESDTQNGMHCPAQSYIPPDCSSSIASTTSSNLPTVKLTGNTSPFSFIPFA